MFLWYLQYFVLSDPELKWNTSVTYTVTVKRCIENGLSVVPTT